MGPPWGIDLMTHHTMSGWSSTDLHLAALVYHRLCGMYYPVCGMVKTQDLLLLKGGTHSGGNKGSYLIIGVARNQLEMPQDHTQKCVMRIIK